MAKKSMIAREIKRIKISRRDKSKRQQLVEKTKSVIVSFEDKMSAALKLNKLPRNGSCSRIKKRCQRCGRPRAVYRRFGLCRICLREAAMRGDVPGLTKASW